ncbi:MAG: hypothetical protein R2731_06835 [Nocardioides sp.]
MTDTTLTSDTTRERWTHPVHVGHLVMGLAFGGLVGIWAAIEYAAVPTADLRWLLPLPWVLGGLAGLLAVLFSGRGRSQVQYAPAEAAVIQPVNPEPDLDTGAGDTPSTAGDPRRDTQEQ